MPFACLQNLRRAFEFLQQNNNVSLGGIFYFMLWCSHKTLATIGYTMKKLVSISVLSLASIGLTTTSVQARPAPQLSTAQFKSCLNRLAGSKTFRRVSSKTFWRYAPATPDATVMPLLNYQPEFTKPVWDYMSVLVDRERVADGIAAKKRWGSVLNRIEARYGVKAEDVLAVWGVESDFGTKLGKRSIVESLATLSCFGRRQSYFRTEYANALRILQAGHVPEQKMTGSWAGAFGQTQFMPSTFLRLAQDFDGDGKKDIVDSVPDALASTANFLKRAGYRTGKTWGYEVDLPVGYQGAKGRRSKRAPSYWRSKGVRLVTGGTVPNSLGKAGLMLPASIHGPAFLVNKNFDTFYSYNASEKYALAIAQLSKKIEQGSLSNIGFVTPWPTNDPGLSRMQNKEIQMMLLDKGYDIGEADGIIGSKTREAIKIEQSRLGMAADGRAGQRFYQKMRGQKMRVK